MSSSCRWIRIEQQIEPFALSRVQAKVDPNLRRITLTTTNVASVTVRSRKLFGDDKPCQIVVDGATLKSVKPENGDVTLNGAPHWFVGPIGKGEKTPEKGGGFKFAMKHRITLVYGT